MPGGQLAELGEAAHQAEPLDGVAGHILQHGADEIAHVEQGQLRQPQQFGGHALRRGAGAPGEMGEPGGARDVDPAADGIDPCRTGVGDHDAGGAEDGDPAHDADAGVPGAPAQLLAAVHRDLDHRIQRNAEALRGAGEVVAQVRAGHRVDRGLAHGDGQARQRDPADAGPAHQRQARTGKCPTHGGADHRTVGHVRVIAGVLLDRGHCHPVGQGLLGEREGRLVAGRQRDLHRIRELSGVEGLPGCDGCGGRARTRRPARPKARGLQLAASAALGGVMVRLHNVAHSIMRGGGGFRAPGATA